MRLEIISLELLEHDFCCFISNMSLQDTSFNVSRMSNGFKWYLSMFLVSVPVFFKTYMFMDFFLPCFSTHICANHPPFLHSPRPSLYRPKTIHITMAQSRQHVFLSPIICHNKQVSHIALGQNLSLHLCL
jgi:hypothetical protein